MVLWPKRHFRAALHHQPWLNLHRSLHPKSKALTAKNTALSPSLLNRNTGEFQTKSLRRKSWPWRGGICLLCTESPTEISEKMPCTTDLADFSGFPLRNVSKPLKLHAPIGREPKCRIWISGSPTHIPHKTHRIRCASYASCSWKNMSWMS